MVSPRTEGLLLLLALPLLGSCDSVTGVDVDMARYDPLPEIDALDFTTVRPAEELLYWELRFSWGGGLGTDSVIGSGGTLPRDELGAETLEALEAVHLPTGFAGRCLPSWCFKFVAAVDETGEVFTVSTAEALEGFLRPVDSLAEAVILLDAHGFSWQDEEQGIRARTGGGWQAVVLELVGVCDPVQTDRVLVDVALDGAVNVVRREVWRRLMGACI